MTRCVVRKKSVHVLPFNIMLIAARTIIARGAVVDQQALETIWKANLDQLHGCEAENKCYLATVQPLDSRKTQERALEFFFESQKASRVALLPRAPLALFASGERYPRCMRLLLA